MGELGRGGRARPPGEGTRDPGASRAGGQPRELPLLMAEPGLAQRGAPERDLCPGYLQLTIGGLCPGGLLSPTLSAVCSCPLRSPLIPSLDLDGGAG